MLPLSTNALMNLPFGSCRGFVSNGPVLGWHTIRGRFIPSRIHAALLEPSLPNNALHDDERRSLYSRLPCASTKKLLHVADGCRFAIMRIHAKIPDHVLDIFCVPGLIVVTPGRLAVGSAIRLRLRRTLK
jgi:hypothetical protein